MQNCWESMENQLTSSGIFSQDLRHWKFSKGSKVICKDAILKQKILEIVLSSCPCSTTSIGQCKETKGIVFQIQIRSRRTRRDSRTNIGRSLMYCRHVRFTQKEHYVNEVTDDFGNKKVEIPKELTVEPETCWKRCMATCGRAAGTRAKRRSRARKEASAQEVRGYYKQFAEAKHLEYRFCVDNEVFDLIDMRKVKPRNYVTGRWVLTIMTDKQGNFLRAKARWVLRGFQDKQEDYQQTDSPASTRPGFRMSCLMAAS